MPTEIEELEKRLELAKAKAKAKPNPYLELKRRRAAEYYIISEGQVPNPDTSDYTKPAVTPAEADEIKKRLSAKGGKQNG